MDREEKAMCAVAFDRQGQHKDNGCRTEHVWVCTECITVGTCDHNTISVVTCDRNGQGGDDVCRAEHVSVYTDHISGVTFDNKDLMGLEYSAFGKIHDSNVMAGIHLCCSDWEQQKLLIQYLCCTVWHLCCSVSHLCCIV